jgi:hypothetical protein
MKEDSLINAKELFLLCTLRGIVSAKNVFPYDWTLNHYSYVQDRLANLSDSDDKSSKEEALIQEAKEKFSIQETKKRDFFLLETDIYFTLCDETGIPWYQPPIDKLVEWAYSGTFILSEKITRKERFIIRSFC